MLDNASPDATPEIARRFQDQCPSLISRRHPENIGSDRNIAESFNCARGRYVWVLGDDDVPLDGTVDWLMENLAAREYGLVYLRPFGFDRDFRSEAPPVAGRVRDYESLGPFLFAVGSHIALISAIVVNKELIPEIDAQAFCGSNLVQVEVYLSAALRAKRFLYSEPYRIAYKRLNTGGFDFTKVFVEKMGGILDRYREAGLSAAAADSLDRAMLIRYFPYHVWLLCSEAADVSDHHARFRARYRGNCWYQAFVDPIFSLPRRAGLLWGLAAIFVGRVASGDLRRGIYFALNRLRNRYQRD